MASQRRVRRPRSRPARPEAVEHVVPVPRRPLADTSAAEEILARIERLLD